MTNAAVQLHIPAPTDHPHIVRTEGICGGRPHIKGSRISVRTIAQLLKMGEKVEDIIAAYSHLAPAAIYDAISYYFDHRADIEDEIRTNQLENALKRVGAFMDDEGIVRFRSGIA